LELYLPRKVTSKQKGTCHVGVVANAGSFIYVHIAFINRRNIKLHV